MYFHSFQKLFKRNKILQHQKVYQSQMSSKFQTVLPNPAIHEPYINYVKHFFSISVFKLSERCGLRLWLRLQISSGGINHKESNNFFSTYQELTVKMRFIVCARLSNHLSFMLSSTSTKYVRHRVKIPLLWHSLFNVRNLLLLGSNDIVQIKLFSCLTVETTEILIYIISAFPFFLLWYWPDTTFRRPGVMVFSRTRSRKGSLFLQAAGNLSNKVLHFVRSWDVSLNKFCIVDLTAWCTWGCFRLKFHTYHLFE